MHLNSKTFITILGCLILNVNFGQVILQDNFEEKFKPVPKKGPGWHANADITGQTGTLKT